MFEEWERKHTVKFDSRTTQYTFYDSWHNMPEDKVFYTSAFTKGLFAHVTGQYRRELNSDKKLVIRVSATYGSINVWRCRNQSCLGNLDSQKAVLHMRPDAGLAY